MYYSFWGACRFVQFSLNECSFSQNHPSMSDFITLFAYFVKM